MPVVVFLTLNLFYPPMLSGELPGCYVPHRVHTHLTPVYLRRPLVLAAATITHPLRLSQVHPIARSFPRPLEKGYLDSLPPVEKRLQEEIDASKNMAQDLKDRLKKANAALAEAKEHLAQRAENRRVVDAAKATAAELAVCHCLESFPC